MKKIMIIMAVALMSACTKEEHFQQPDSSNIMKFDIVHPGTKATETSFENGDRIGLFVVEYDGENQLPLQISGNWANNVETTYSNGIWTTEKKVFWSENKVDVYGYYPYMDLVSVDEQPFSVALDQNNEGTDGKMGGYEASDFLWAKTAAAEQSQESVALQFRHCMSKFVVRLVKGADFEGELPNNAVLYLHNTITEARLDLATGTAVKNGFATPNTITMHKVSNDTYEAIVVPQRLETRRPFVEMIAGNVSYLVESSFNFKAGMMHTMSLTINSNPEQVEIEIGGSVGGDWN